jgi:hypothetical protein
MGLLSGIKRVGNAALRALGNVMRSFGEIGRRIFKIVDFFAALLGIWPEKKLMLRIIVLSEHGSPVVPEDEVNRWLNVTRDVFKDRCNVKIIPPLTTDGRHISFISVVDGKHYHAALSIDCGFGTAWTSEIDELEANTTGYAQPTAVGYVVRDITGDAGGCSWPLLNNVFVLDRQAKSTAMAHELGHMCWLPHSHSGKNLMNPERDDMDSRLKRIQIALLRSSKYAYFFE